MLCVASASASAEVKGGERSCVAEPEEESSRVAEAESSSVAAKQRSRARE